MATTLSQNVTQQTCFPFLPSFLSQLLLSKPPRSLYATYTTLFQLATSPPKFPPRCVSFRRRRDTHRPPSLFSHHTFQCNATCSPILTTLQNCQSWSCACTEANAQAVENCGDCVAAVVPLSTAEVQYLLDGAFWSFLSIRSHCFFFPQNMRQIAHRHLFHCRQRSLSSRLHQLPLQLHEMPLTVKQPAQVSAEP
jgi:hypothetical protein